MHCGLAAGSARPRDVGLRGAAVRGGGAEPVPGPWAAALGTAPGPRAAAPGRGGSRGGSSAAAAAAEAPLVAVRPVAGGLGTGGGLGEMRGGLG